MRPIIVTTLGILALVATTMGASAQGINPTHYQCYSIKAEDESKQIAVNLRDQFGRSEVVVLNPDRLCAPASKNGEPVTDKNTHYLCYIIEGGKVVQKRVAVKNQFGTHRYIVEQANLLCVPSSKKVLKQRT